VVVERPGPGGWCWLAAGERDVPATALWLHDEERRALEAMRFTKRHDEWRIARWTAKRALAAALGLPDDLPSLAGVRLRRDPDGAPEPYLDDRPAPCSVSSTDRAGWAVCLVGPPGRRIGVDLELVEARSAAFVGDWFTPVERDRVEAATGDDERHCLANLVWSAKESALKVLRTGLRRSTHSVEVDLGPVSPAEAERAWQPLVVRTAGGRELPGWWRRFGAFVLTAAADGPVGDGPPRSLVEPPPLASAEPSHSWLVAPRRSVDDPPVTP
jgi:4'-phosphopantetheinyl transferase